MLILKIVNQDGSHFYQADVKSAVVKPDTVRCFVADPFKTALVPGFSEHETNIDIPEGSSVYLMNESGKTVSRYESSEAAPLAA